MYKSVSAGNGAIRSQHTAIDVGVTGVGVRPGERERARANLRNAFPLDNPRECHAEIIATHR